MRSASILIVEDSYLNAMQAERVLTGAGHRIVGMTAKPIEALRLAARHRPDLAVMNVQRADNTAALQLAAEIVRLHGARILIVTGFPEAVLKQAGLLKLACEVVRKPYADEELLAAVAKCLAPEGTEAPAASAVS